VLDIFALIRQLHVGLGFLQKGIELACGLYVLGQARPIALELLDLVLIAPDFRLGQAALQLFEALLLPGDIKDTSGALSPWK
jgi:hypothetical protein